MTTSDPPIEAQLDLFAGADAVDAPGSREDPRFYAPCPGRLLVQGNCTLVELLRDSGSSWIFEVHELLDEIDWSPFLVKYKGGGAPAYHPRDLMGLILLAGMEGQSSLRQIERFARFDVRAWWFVGQRSPDHSTLGQFVVRHSEILSGDFFERLTREILRRLGTRVTLVAVDGTIFEALASTMKALRLEALREREAKARAAAENSDDDSREARQAEKLGAALEVAEARDAARTGKGKNPGTVTVHPDEPEAVLQRQKNKSFALSYKNTIAVGNHRLILGTEVHPSSETAVFEALLDSIEAVAPEGLEAPILADAGFFKRELLRDCADRGLDILIPQGRNGGPKKSSKGFLKNRFEYDSSIDRYRCPAGRLLKPEGRAGTRKGRRVQSYRAEKSCEDCPLLDQCMTARSGGSRTTGGSRRKVRRRISRCEGDDVAEAMAQVMEQPLVQDIYRKRKALAEPPFSELRGPMNRHRFRRPGLAGARLESKLMAMSYNMRRFRAVLGKAGESESRRLIIVVTAADAPNTPRTRPRPAAGAPAENPSQESPWPTWLRAPDDRYAMPIAA